MFSPLLLVANILMHCQVVIVISYYAAYLYHCCVFSVCQGNYICNWQLDFSERSKRCCRV